jgi:hypothetical protein
MGKTGKNLKAWSKKAWSAVKKDPSIISKQIDKLQKRGLNVSGKAQDAYGKLQSGDYLGAIRAGHDTYRAAVGGKKDDQWLKSNKSYRRVTNVGSKTLKAAEAFNAGDNEQGFKHAMDAARAAIGKAKLIQMQQSKVGQHAVAARQAYKAAKGAYASGEGGLGTALAGITTYADRRKIQTAKTAPIVQPTGAKFKMLKQHRPMGRSKL